VLKTLQLLPGVQSGGEGTNGLYVRGGSPDQNLVLLDGVPVYNVSHVLGIFSVFNADAIKNVTLTKGGFPARFGGRLSSVLEINMKEGNMREYHGEGSIGLISSKFTFEGPIKTDKTSFIISGRRTYADLIFRPIIKSQARQDGGQITPKLYFYDLNAKLQHKINDKHRLFLSAYSGADVFYNKYEEDDLVSEGGVDWGNLISALRWNYQISNKLFLNTTLTYSNYQINFSNGFEDKDEDDRFLAKYISGIEDWAGKLDFDYIPSPNHYIRFGGNATHHTYRPGALSFELESGDENLDTLIGSLKQTSMEYALYVEDDMKFGNFKANVGLHASAFNVDETFYTSLQPRLGMRYLMDNGVAFKGAFSTMTQFINLLTSEALNLPSDLWVPSTEDIKPQRSWQAALGVAKTINDKYELSIEGFYKKMKDLVSYREGASFFTGFGNDWTTKVTQGDGEAYGAEFFIQKKKGKTTGWIGYTLSWNFRQFPEINGGERYPFRYDRRHDISVVVAHKLSDRINLSSAWVFGTGNAISLPTARYDVGGFNPQSSFWQNGEIEVLGDKNAYRMSNYHRLDFSVEFIKQKARYERKWILSVYNAYWNRNPYYAFVEDEFDSETRTNRRVIKEISILPIIPSIAYAFKF
ncbi:MAG: TonB-dependent receptor plug domain-containing protein, partial [Bacteroidota bacterium]